MSSKNLRTTVDEKEVEFFRKNADLWWNPNGVVKTLHEFNKLRLPMVPDELFNSGKISEKSYKSAKPLSNLKILDVGCGSGLLSEPLAQMGANVTGLDACEDLIKCAVVHANKDEGLNDTLQFVLSTIEEFCEDNAGKFDVVVASEIVEHVNEHDTFLSSCIKTLKPGGSIFITTFNRTYLSWLIGILFYENVSGSIRKGTHDWYKFISREDLEKILENHGCKTVMRCGTIINPFNRTWHKISNDSVHYHIHAIKQ